MGGGSSVLESEDWDSSSINNSACTYFCNSGDVSANDRSKFYRRVKRFARESLLTNMDASSVFTFLAAPGAYAAFRRFVCENKVLNQEVFLMTYYSACVVMKYFNK